MGGFAWFVNGVRPANDDKILKRFVVNQGETAYQIGQNLQKTNLIKNAIAFRIYAQVTQAARVIQPGSYELPGNLWVPQIINKLLDGPTEIWVTIPEGFRREEIANKFITSLELSGEQAESFRSSFLELTQGKEGYLFPDTYLVAKEVTPQEVITLMSNNFKTKVNFSTTNQQITLASILERETRTDEERPIVAGILTNRINAGWPIQADATIQYVIGDSENYWPTVTPADLQIDSAYNTYTNTGLPPTPISNPGLSSIKAATNPSATEYWYYIHDKNGQIYYATTLEEQNANIAKYLQ